MSSFAADVEAALDDGTSVSEVDAALALAKVIPSGVMPVPRRLRLQRLTFSGVKPVRSVRHTEALRDFREVIPAGASISIELDAERGKKVEAHVGELLGTDSEPEVGEPFTFVWDLGPGLYALGSHENFRGKSTVLETILWALRGPMRAAARCSCMVSTCSAQVRRRERTAHGGLQCSRRCAVRSCLGW